MKTMLKAARPTASGDPKVHAAKAGAALDRSRVERLRNLRDNPGSADGVRPTLEQVQLIVSAIGRGVNLDETAKLLSEAGVADPAKFVLDVVSTFGTWLAHSNGAAGATVDWDTPLGSQLRLFAEDGNPVVAGPQGYAPGSEHKRDVSKALAAVATAGQSPDVVSRFVTRTYAVRQAKLVYPIVAGVWGFAVMNRLGTLDEVSNDPVFLAHAVEAYDLLDVARQDGVEAVVQLAETASDESETIVDLATKSYWLAERQMTTIRSAARMAGTDRVAEARLRKELAYLKLQLEAGAFPLPWGVRHLTLGQVHRICEASGIPVTAEKAVEESEIRATLKALGYATDTDMLLPIALECAQTGTLERFWEVMQARGSGDPTWSDDLAELVP